MFTRAAIAVEPVALPAALAGRVTAAHVQCGTKGGMVVVSVYLQHGIGVTAHNIETLAGLGRYLNDLAVPWVAGGDWNTPHTELSDAGWTQSVRGAAAAGPDATGTCRGARGGWSNIDYFVVPRTLQAAVAATRVVLDAGASPRPVSYTHLTLPTKRIV